MWIGLWLSLAAIGTTASPDVVTARQQIEQARVAIDEHRPADALQLADGAVRALDTADPADGRRRYCAMSATETIAYMALATKDRREAIAIDPALCDALYLKGFALFDLQRMDEARAAYTRALTLAPMHARFLTEMGQTYRVAGDWAAMRDWCARSEGYARMAQADEIDAELRRSWHCQGYAISEQGDLDTAEALYRRCLETDPNDALAKNELAWIAGQRAKRKIS